MIVSKFHPKSYFQLWESGPAGLRAELADGRDMKENGTDFQNVSKTNYLELIIMTIGKTELQRQAHYTRLANCTVI